MEDLEFYESLKEKLGTETGKALFDRLQGKAGELATKQDLLNLENSLKAHISDNNANMVWKVAGFLLAQAAVIVTLIKLIP